MPGLGQRVGFIGCRIWGEKKDDGKHIMLPTKAGEIFQGWEVHLMGCDTSYK